MKELQGKTVVISGGAEGIGFGIAQAMAESDLPYIISFVIGKDGRILDGTSLENAISILVDRNGK